MRESAFSICRKGVLRDVFPRVGKVDGTCRVGLSHVWKNGEGRAASRCLRSIQKKRARKHGVLASLYFCMEAEPHCVPSPLSPLLDRFWGRDPGVKVSAPWRCRAAWHSLNQHPGVAELLHVDFVFVCHDSAKQASLMALAAPNARPRAQASLVSWRSLNQHPGLAELLCTRPRARASLGAWHSLNQHLASALDVHSLFGHGIQLPALQVVHGGLFPLWGD